MMTSILGKEEIMEKDKILENSRNENKGKDYYAMEIENKGCKLASIAILLMSLLYYLFEEFTGRGSNPAFYSLIMAFNFVECGYKAIKLEEKRKLYAFISIASGLCTLVLILKYFGII